MCPKNCTHRVTIPWARLQKAVPSRSWDDFNTCMAREPTPVVSVPFYRLRASRLLPVTNTATFAPKRLIIRIVFCIHVFEVSITGLFTNGGS